MKTHQFSNDAKLLVTFFLAGNSNVHLTISAVLCCAAFWLDSMGNKNAKEADDKHPQDEQKQRKLTRNQTIKQVNREVNLLIANNFDPSVELRCARQSFRSIGRSSGKVEQRK